MRVCRTYVLKGGIPNDWKRFQTSDPASPGRSMYPNVTQCHVRSKDELKHPQAADGLGPCRIGALLGFGWGERVLRMLEHIMIWSRHVHHPSLAVYRRYVKSNRFRAAYERTNEVGALWAPDRLGLDLATKPRAGHIVHMLRKQALCFPEHVIGRTNT